MKRKVLGSNPSLAIQRQLIPRCVGLVRSPLQRAVIERYATIVQTKQGTRTVCEFSKNFQPHLLPQVSKTYGGSVGSRVAE